MIFEQLKEIHIAELKDLTLRRYELMRALEPIDKRLDELNTILITLEEVEKQQRMQNDKS